MNADQARFLADHYATLIEKELPATASVLDAVNEGDRDYKPDPKSRSAWDLAIHIARADTFLIPSALKGNFDYDPEAGKKWAAQFTDAAQIAAFYRGAVPETLKQVRAASPEQLLRDINFFGLVTGPAANMLVFAHDHSLHHRGQLAAYLRPMGSKVPNIYGPSADTRPATT
jgi:uncharacterized damage-inducible protein DinB